MTSRAVAGSSRRTKPQPSFFRGRPVARRDAARRLLERLAWLAPDSIPESLLETPVGDEDPGPQGSEERAHRERRSESEIVRDALAAWLFPEDEDPGGESAPLRMKSRPKPTTPGGLARKCCYIDPEETARLRRLAFDLERSESDLMREAISGLLDRFEAQQ